MLLLLLLVLLLVLLLLLLSGLLPLVCCLPACLGSDVGVMDRRLSVQQALRVAVLRTSRSQCSEPPLSCCVLASVAVL